jgi:hypothetical protein
LGLAGLAWAGFVDAGLAIELLALAAAGLTAVLAGCFLLLAVFFLVCGTK